MKTRFWIAALAVWPFLLTRVSLGDEQRNDQQRFDPAALSALPDNTWMDLQLTWRGGNEIPAVFDAGNGVLFKYGGCGDRSPRGGGANTWMRGGDTFLHDPHADLQFVDLHQPQVARVVTQQRTSAAPYSPTAGSRCAGVVSICSG